MRSHADGFNRCGHSAHHRFSRPRSESFAAEIAWSVEENLRHARAFASAIQIAPSTLRRTVLSGWRLWMGHRLRHFLRTLVIAWTDKPRRLRALLLRSERPVIGGPNEPRCSNFDNRASHSRTDSNGVAAAARALRIGGSLTFRRKKMLHFLAKKTSFLR